MSTEVRPSAPVSYFVTTIRSAASCCRQWMRINFASTPARLALFACAAAVLLGQAKAQNLTVVTPGEGSFESLLDNNFNGISALPDYSAMKPYLAIVKNDSGSAVKAYSVAWHLETADGLERMLTTQYAFRHLEPLSLSRVVKPGGLRLVSPVFNLSPAEYQANHDFYHRYPSTFFPTLAPEVSVQVVVDAEVTVDGAMSGPNKTHLLELNRATRYGEHDEAVSLLSRMETAMPLASPLEFLNADVALATQFHQEVSVAELRGRPLAAYYLRARGQSAKALIEIYKQRGPAAFKDELAVLADSRPAKQASFLQKYFTQ